MVASLISYPSYFPVLAMAALLAVANVLRGVRFFRQRNAVRRFAEEAGWQECSFLGRGATGVWQGRAVTLRRRRNRDWMMRIDAPFHMDVVIESARGFETLLRRHRLEVPELPEMRCFGDPASVEKIARDPELRPLVFEALAARGSLIISTSFAEAIGARDENGLRLEWQLLSRLAPRYS